MKDTPCSRAAAIQFIAKHPNLIRRPLVFRGHEIILGYDENAFRKPAKQKGK
jgi:3-hydroxybutyryl-CoA dehydrogenase